MKIDNQKLNVHLIDYWDQTILAYKQESYNFAVFFAITLIEEIGKVIMIHHNMISQYKIHQEKYKLGGISNLYVNSRVQRIYGKNESKFTEWLKSKELFNIRNKALYMEIIDNEILFPADMISLKDAHLLVCMAGEIFAEFQGEYIKTGPEEWRKILENVDQMRDPKLLQFD